MNKFVKLLALSVIGIASQTAMASDGTITFTGQILGTTCTVGDNTGTPGNYTVALPAVSTSALSSVGKTAGATFFQIDLTGCSLASSPVHAYFEAGSNVDLANKALFNTDASLTKAQYVEVQLLNASDDVNPILLGNPDGSQNSGSTTIASSKATLKYTARYLAVAGGTVTAGPVTAAVTYSLIYQ